jgi:hypothetical protein
MRRKTGRIEVTHPMRPGSARVHHELCGLYVGHIGLRIKAGREYLRCRGLKMLELLRSPFDVLRIL